MSVQSVVNIKQTPGIAGDFFDDSPRRVDPKVLTAADGSLPTVGNVFTVADAANPSVVILGGTGSVAGILVNGKELVRSNGLTAGLTVDGDTVGSIMAMGRCWVKVGNEITINSLPAYDTTTGAIVGVASAAGEGQALIPGAKFVEVNSAANGLAVIQLG